MDERKILEQRVATLNGLLETTGGSLGPAGGALGTTLRGKWEAERRLLRRVLAETPGQDVRATLDLWGERTAAFMEKSGDSASWHDREGIEWHAAAVLDILVDIEERLNSWREAEQPLPVDEEDDEMAGDEDEEMAGDDPELTDL